MSLRDEFAAFLPVAEDVRGPIQPLSLAPGVTKQRDGSFEFLSWEMPIPNTATLTPSGFYLSASGNDLNTGRTPSQAWQTLSKLNTAIAGGPVSGKHYFFHGGDTFTGTLLLTGTSPTSLVTVTSYGTGQATINGGDLSPVIVDSIGNVIVNNLHLAGSGVASDGTTTTKSWTGGVWIQNTGSVQRTNVNVTNCTFTGLNIGIAVTSWTATPGSSITVPSLTGKLAGFSSCSFTGNTISACAVAGVYSQGVDIFDDDAAHWHNHSLTISGNTISNIYGISGVNSGYGVTCLYTTDSVILSNDVHDCGQVGGDPDGGGPGGIDVFHCDAIRMAYNQAYRIFDAGGVDGIGIGIDLACTNCTIEYNYTHDCKGPGYLMFGDAACANNTFRYNIDVNSGRGTQHSKTSGIVVVENGTGTGLAIYNNTFYNDTDQTWTDGAVVALVQQSSGVTFANNLLILRGSGIVNAAIFYSTHAIPVVGNFYDSPGTFQGQYNSTLFTSLASLRTLGGEKIGGTSYGFASTAPVLDMGTNGNVFPVTGLTAYDPTVLGVSLNAGQDLNALFSIAPGTVDFHGNPNQLLGQYGIGAVGRYGVGKPTSLTAGNPTGSTIDLAWTAPAGSGVTYSVYRGTSGSGEDPTPVATGISATSYTDTLLGAETQYFYLVTATINDGEGFASNEANATTLEGIPGPPTSVSAVAGDTQIIVNGTPPAGTVGSYKIYLGTTPGGEAGSPVASGVALPHTLTGLTNGVHYYVTVKATNSHGDSLTFSNEADATPAVKQSTHSLIFNGSNQSGDGTITGLTGAPTVSLSFWIKTTSTTTNTYVISFPTAGPDVGLEVLITSSTALRAYCNVSTQLSVFTADSIHGAPGNFNDGNWHHVAVTWDGTTLTVYLDNVLDNAGNSVATGTGAMVASLNAFHFGRFDASGAYAAIQLDDIAVIRGVVLTPTQIGQILAGTLDVGTLDYSAGGGLWRFEEGSGTTIADSKNSHNGTLTNAPTWSTDVPGPLG